MNGIGEHVWTIQLFGYLLFFASYSIYFHSYHLKAFFLCLFVTLEVPGTWCYLQLTDERQTSDMTSAGDLVIRKG